MVVVRLQLTGVPQGWHGLHLHAVGKCESPFLSAGPHFNPGNHLHGFEQKAGHHAGDLPNLVVSPHMAGDFAGHREALVELFVENLERYLTGRPLKNVVDKSLGFVP